MTVHALHPDASGIRSRLLAALDAALPTLSAHAREDDVRASFPAAAVATLADCQLMTAVLPLDEGGAGLGIDRSSVPTLLQVLLRLGAAHLSLARLYEGHVNAFALLWHHGSTVQRLRLMRHVRDGGMLGVWNAPSPDGPLRLERDGTAFVLHGSKIYASGAGSITRPLLTATDPDGRMLMLWCDVSKATVDLSGWKVHGMRATDTGTIVLDDIPVAKDELFGADQDYHRQPAFSGGAWRFVAAQLGAAGALVDLMKASLLQARRQDDPHQRARLADATMALETGRLWTTSAARIAEDPSSDAAEAVSYVGMARLVVEQVCMDIMALAQRSVGLRAFHEANPMERIARDLATYLRQPVPDAIRDGAAESALHFTDPSLDRWAP